MRKLVILNGLTGSGKDHLVNHCEHFRDIYAFADKVKLDTFSYFNLDITDINAFEKVKDQPLTEFKGMTQREANIMVAEHIVKPNLGDDYYGKYVAEQIVSKGCDEDDVIDVIKDGGFKQEIICCLNLVKDCYDIIIFIRIHCQSDNPTEDSREYLYPSKIDSIKDCGILEFDVYNDKATDHYIETIKSIVYINANKGDTVNE